MTLDPVSYLTDAIQRIEGGDAVSNEGSHVAGIFLKAANRFEKEIRTSLAAQLRLCELNYDQDVRRAIKGEPAFHKLTLGNCVAAMREAANLRPPCIGSTIPARWTLESFLKAISNINDAWVTIKHGDQVHQSVLVAQMKSMLTIYQALRSRKVRT